LFLFKIIIKQYELRTQPSEEPVIIYFCPVVNDGEK